MVLGLAVFTWDQKKGSVLEVKYPNSLNLSTDLINKIYMTHAYSDDLEEKELIEINYQDKKILSYCDKKKVAEVGYEILILLLDQAEKVNIHQIKKKFIGLGQDLFELDSRERKDYFLEEVDKFYQEPSARKILILGRAGTGKTSIKQIVFEGNDPKELLFNPLEPTRGIAPSVHSWLDFQLGLFDTSGQELQGLLNENNHEEQTLAFENADIVLYIFDYSLWVNNKEDIFDDIEKINSIIEKSVEATELIIFLHKIDLIEKSYRLEILNKIKKKIKEKFGCRIFFTSIYSKLIYRLYNAFYEILSSLSEDAYQLKTIIDGVISDLEKIMCFITNKNDAIIVQTMSSDFNTLLINHTHTMIAQLTQSFENMAKNNNIEHFIISGSDSLNLIMNYLNLSELKLKNLLIISEKLSANTLILLAGKIRARVNSYFIRKT